MSNDEQDRFNAGVQAWCDDLAAFECEQMVKRKAQREAERDAVTTAFCDAMTSADRYYDPACDESLPSGGRGVGKSEQLRAEVLTASDDVVMADELHKALQACRQQSARVAAAIAGARRGSVVLVDDVQREFDAIDWTAFEVRTVLVFYAGRAVAFEDHALLLGMMGAKIAPERLDTWKRQCVLDAAALAAVSRASCAA